MLDPGSLGVMRRRVLLIASLLLLAGGTQAVGGLDEDPAPAEEPVLVTLDTWPPQRSLMETMDHLGVEERERFDVAQTMLVDAPVTSHRQLAMHPSVTGIYADEPLDPQLASSKPAAGVTERLHRAGVTGEDVTVAVVDSGIAADHAGLDEEMAGQYTVDDDGVHGGADDPSKHGTHVAGILAGSGEGAGPDRDDVRGVAPAAQVVSFDISQDFTTSNALRAFEWIYENHEEEDIDAVTNAWGRLESPATYDPDDPVVRASSALVADGLVTVFSAGNGGGQDSRMTVEATNPDVITVGAATDQGEIESYSSRGPVYDTDGNPVNWTKPDLVAPGSHVVSTQPAGEPGPAYTTMNGTSMAAPHVAGTVALVLDQRPDLAPEEVKSLLVRAAQDVGPTGVDDASGAGMVDAESAIRLLEESSGTMESRQRSSQHSEQLTGPAQGEAVFGQAEIDNEDTIEIDVPANGTKLETEIRWGGEGDLEASFQRPDGSTARTIDVSAERSLAIQDPVEGEWTISVQPQDVSRGSYHANVTVTWLEPVNGSTVPFSAERSAEGTFPSTGGPLDPWAESWLPGVPNIALMLAGGAMTVTMLVGRIRR